VTLGTSFDLVNAPLAVITAPTLPKLLEGAFTPKLDGASPTNFPRNDLVTTFLKGIKGVNQPLGVEASEMLRLNAAIPATPETQQNRLGIVGNILAGGTDALGFGGGDAGRHALVRGAHHEHRAAADRGCHATIAASI
jgi:hypothetical protein